MKKIFLALNIILGLMLAACVPTATPTAIPTVVLNANSAAASASVSASGQIVPAPKAQLSFPLNGVVKTVEVKAGDTVTAGQTLVTLDTTLLEAKVREAQANVDAANADLQYQIRTGADQEHLKSAQAAVDGAQAQLDSANATLAQATLVAPFAGTIAEVNINPAEAVTPGLIVISMGDFTHFQVETTDLSERDVPNVKAGQKANVFVQALNKNFPATVQDVSDISSTVGGDVVYKVTLEFDQQPAGLLWGMSTVVMIQTGN
jgi:multidrug efflux pump subunit AcrA (membrane-fusion protein)